MAAVENYANNATTTVSSGGTSGGTSGTIESWTVASSATFPAAATGVTQFHVGDPAKPTELIAVTNVSGTIGATWTVTRGAENTTPVAHAAGFTVDQVITAGGLGSLFTGNAAAALNPVNITLTGLSYSGTALNAFSDGASHPLSGVFSTVAQAETAFAVAYAATGIAPVLTDELNWWVIQNYLVDGNLVYAPAGTYLLHRALILPNGLATGLAVRGAGKSVTTFKLRSHTVTGGLNDCSVFIDEQLLAAATATPGIGYNYNNALSAALSSYLTLEEFAVDGNSANVGSGFYAGYNYGIGINAESDITVSNVQCRNVNGWGYREGGTQITSGSYAERGSYTGLTAYSCAFWGIYVGFRNRKKSMANCIAMNCGTNGLCGTVKGSVQITAPGGFFLDCSEMQTNGLQAHGNNGDGIYIRNVFACQYQGFKATFNGGSGIHVLGLVNSMGADWLAQCNGTNPGNGQNNLASPAPDSGGSISGGAGTYTGATDVYFDDSTNTYGITTLSEVTGVECGVNTTVTTTWGYAGAETYGLWIDDGLGTSDLAIRSLHNTSTLRNAASPGSALIVGDVVLDSTATDIQPGPGTRAAGSVGKGADAGHVHGQPPFFAPIGLTGATAASRYAGATASGAPVSGTFATGDYTVDQTGALWICTAAGTAGTWVNAGSSGSSGVSAFNSRSGAVTPGNADYLAVAHGGLTGATAATRYVGGVTSGAPVSGTFATGDYIVDQTGIQWICTTAGTAGTWTMSTGKSLRDVYLRSSAILGESFPRSTMQNSSIVMTSGTLYLQALALPIGAVVGHLQCASNGAAVSPTHWWFGLFDSSRNLLALTADQLTTAWGGGTYQSQPVATIASGSAASFTTTYTGLYYFGFMMAAGTTVTLIGAGASSNAIIGQTPVLCAPTNTGQTTPPAFAFQASSFVTANTGIFYAAVAT